MRFPLLAAVLLPALTIAQPPPGYYDSAEGLTGEPLRMALRDIISPHTVVAYSQLWGAFYRCDRRTNNTVWDIYSDIPGGSPPYAYQFGTDQCGTYNSEGDCFNREHSFPVSWFNDVPPMNSDIHHIYPTDAWVNQARGSWPYGEVSSAAFTSENGSKRGTCNYPGCTGTVFEPIDAYKGDLARAHFYMLTRYMNEAVSWPAPILSNGEFFGWVENMLVDWHTQDPVSAKEIARNDSTFIIQGNRNPYIDNPQWVYSIWGPEASVPEQLAPSFRAWFAEGQLHVIAEGSETRTFEVLDITGRVVSRIRVSGGRTDLPLEMPAGAYLLRLSDTPTGAVRFVR
ncbi:MAG: endonuclease [Flavobacteriales bacterium]|nr:endonuclease [Flavobacteriales bacterium]